MLPAAVLCGGLLVGELIFRKRLNAAQTTNTQSNATQTVPSCSHAQDYSPVLAESPGYPIWVFLVPAAAVGWRANLDHLDTWIARVAANDQVGQDNDFNARSKRNQSFASGVRRRKSSGVLIWLRARRSTR